MLDKIILVSCLAYIESRTFSLFYLSFPISSSIAIATMDLDGVHYSEQEIRTALAKAAAFDQPVGSGNGGAPPAPVAPPAGGYQFSEDDISRLLAEEGNELHPLLDICLVLT